MTIEMELSLLVNSLMEQKVADQATIARLTEEIKELRIMYEAEILSLRHPPRR